MKPYAIQFEPIFKERIWGGQRLRTYFGKAVPAGVLVGESWELADLPNDKSRIRNGPLSGLTLHEAIRIYGHLFVPTESSWDLFPLLVKFLDAQNILSVQVHPDKAACLRSGKGDMKSECWYVLDAQPDAVIYKGLKSGVTRSQFEQAVRNETVTEVLQRFVVHPGECHYIPAGTCHAIGAGLFLAEIQTPSDTTYRVFDWNRRDEQGKCRPVHIEDALNSIRFDQLPDELTVRSEGVLVDCDHFRVEKQIGRQSDSTPIQSGRLEVLIIVSGTGLIDSTHHFTTPFHPGDTILIPLTFIGSIHFESDCVYLSVSL